MSERYAVAVPDGAPGWCPVLTQSITACFKTLTEDLTGELRGTNSSVKSIEDKFDRLSQQLLAEVESANAIAKEALTIANEAKQEVLSMNNKCDNLVKENFTLKMKNNGLEQDYARLQKQQNSLESYSKRDNLLIHGVKDEGNDDDESCIALVRSIFIEQLGLSEADATNMVFVRCHRMGRKSPYGKRPIIVRFQYYADRQCIWNKRFHLKGTAYSLHENFANEVEYRRKLMYPILAAAKRSAKYNKVYLNSDILRIDGKDYTVDDLQHLPRDLHPDNYATRENDQWFVFGGIHSSYNFLSNFYAAPVTYKNIDFPDVERAYQYAKADTFNDKNSGANILCSRSPSSAKKIGATVKNFKVKEWDRVKKDIMLQLLKAKFTPGSDLAKTLVATSSKSLAEAGQCPTFSIGMTLSNKELFNINKWTKNILGQLLMKVRDDLK